MVLHLEKLRHHRYVFTMEGRQGELTELGGDRRLVGTEPYEKVLRVGQPNSKFSWASREVKKVRAGHLLAYITNRPGSTG